MPIWSDDYLSTLLNRGEYEFSQFIPSIFYRFSLEITKGTSIYQLPQGVIRILRVTWKGIELEPVEHADGYSPFFRPNEYYSEGVPRWYLTRWYGDRKIKFHPRPNESISADDTGVMGSDIENRVIVTAYRYADPTGTDYRIPEYLRRRYLKYYVMYHAYKREGKGQDLDAAQYFKQKLEFVKQRFKEIYDKIPTTVLTHLHPTSFDRIRFKKPAYPSLPMDDEWAL